MKKLWERIAESLSGKKSSDEIHQVWAEANSRITEVEARIALISEFPNMGAERIKVLTSGSPDDVVELDNELTRLTAERKQLFHQRTELHQMVGKARAQESLENAGKLKSDFSAAVNAAQKAERAFLEARQTVEDLAKTVSAGRSACKQHGIHPDEIQVDEQDAEWLARKLFPGEDRDQRARRFKKLIELIPAKTAKRLTGAASNTNLGARAA